MDYKRTNRGGEYYLTVRDRTYSFNDGNYGIFPEESSIQKDFYIPSGKKLLILDYQYEPDPLKNCSYSSKGILRSGIVYLQPIMRKIISGYYGCNMFGCDYYKLTLHTRDSIFLEHFNEIIKRSNPDYILIISMELFERLPFIFSEGPVLSLGSCFAETFFIGSDTGNKKILTLPMPHPKTPGFDEHVEDIWHQIISFFLNTKIDE